METEYDYVPAYGFHSKPSISWPPPTPDEMRVLGIPQNPLNEPDYVLEVDGQPHVLTDQINMYATNLQLTQPLVSPVLAASLGGFCPCQVITGAAELLRDEQIFLAHKMANPTDFPLSEDVIFRNKENPDDINKHPPTEVELLVFDDGPHAAPTLGHIDVAKHEYRAVSQFLAKSLARAQNVAIEIEDYIDDYAPSTRDSPPVPSLPNEGTFPFLDTNQRRDTFSNSPVSDSPIAMTPDGSDTPWLSRKPSCDSVKFKCSRQKEFVGLRAGDTLPPGENNMVRFRVSRQGKLYTMEAPHLLRALNYPLDLVGQPKEAALKGWQKYHDKLSIKFASEKVKGKLPLTPRPALPAPRVANTGRHSLCEAPGQYQAGLHRATCGGGGAACGACRATGRRRRGGDGETFERPGQQRDVQALLSGEQGRPGGRGPDGHHGEHGLCQRQRQESEQACDAGRPQHVPAAAYYSRQPPAAEGAVDGRRAHGVVE